MFSSLWQALSEHPEFIAMLTIPPVTAFCDLGACGMALEMLFYPIKFWGIRIFGLPFSLKGVGVARYCACQGWQNLWYYC